MTKPILLNGIKTGNTIRVPLRGIKTPENFLKCVLAILNDKDVIDTGRISEVVSDKDTMDIRITSYQKEGLRAPDGQVFIAIYR